ncbi:MAG TPA: PEGA domain-containing protein [Polyangiaceae bacterium]|jgi:hypothetical protein
MMIRPSRLAVLLGALCLSLNSFAFAAEPDAAETSKAEARKRFDRGLTLFNEGDNAGALAEFKQTYAIMPNPVVLYNIGLVYAAMGRPVEAVDALNQVVTSSSLSPEQQERAKQTLSDQQARIGRVSVTTTPEGAHVEIDNVEVATTPLSGPLRVSEGTHVVGVVAEGYATARREVVVAGNADATLHFDMVRAVAKRPANLTVHTRLIAADVLIDDKSVGQTPLSSSVAVPAGHHTVEVRRKGYTTAKQDVDLGEGATGDITLSPTIDQQALAGESALLTLDLHGHASDLFVDEDHIGPYTGPVRLPKGAHNIRLESAGFLPFEQSVTVGSVEGQIISVRLAPTPETRAAHDSNVRFHRTFGWIGVGAGAAIAGASGIFLAVHQKSPSKSLQSNYDAAIAARNDGNTLPHCNLFGGAGPDTNTPDECNAYVDDQATALNNAQSKINTQNTIGYIGLGVGGALAITGVVLLLTGESAHEYDDAPATGDAPRKRWALAPGPGQFGMGLSAAF